MSNGLMCALLLLTLCCGYAYSQTTQFSYQGSLRNGTAPANGNHDFLFALFDAPSGGSQIGVGIQRSDIPVSDGLFSVSLSFGQDAFSGEDRFLEVQVRPSGSGDFTLLGPRQHIKSSPYSIKSLNAANATNALQLGGVGANQYVLTADPRMTDARNPLPGSTSYIHNSASVQPNSNFSISGNGTASIFTAATSYNIGAAPVLRTTATNTFVGRFAGGNTTGTGNSFFGDIVGATTTTGTLNSFFGGGAGNSNTIGSRNSYFGFSSGSQTTGNDNSFFGLQAGVSNTTGSGNAAIGRQADFSAGDLTNATAIGFRSMAGQSNSIVLGSISGVNGATASTNVGIGTTTPAARLHVAGDGLFTGNLSTGGVLSANELNAVSQFGLGGIRILTADGNGNIYVGRAVGPAAAGTSEDNTFVGNSVGTASTGNLNSFFGANAGASNTIGAQNTFIGESAGNANTSGQSNAFVGKNAGISNIGGSLNTFVGTFAGVLSTTGNNNAFFGVQAGQSNTTGSNNTLIGASANVGSGSLTNATAIGSLARVTQSNSLILGGITGVSGGTDTKVGIGTTAPTSKLTVAGSGVLGANSAARIDLFNSVAGTTYFQQVFDDGRWQLGSGSTARILVEPNGNVGIGVTAPNDKLNVSGTIALATLGSAGLTSLCRNNINQISTCSSSARYKSNIRPLSSGLDLVKKLRPVSFDWKNTSTHDIGLVAEEVARIEPLLTVRNAEGEVEGVKYDRIGVVLVNAVKEQQSQIVAQQKLIESQQKQIDALRALVCTSNAGAAVCKE